MKSTVEEIRQRFDAEVDVYTNLATGQVSAVDSALAMSLVAEAAAVTTPHATHLLEVGCGGGNYTLKLLEQMPNLNVTLVDLSRAMLDLAVPRVRPKTIGSVETLQSDTLDGVSTLNLLVEVFNRNPKRNPKRNASGYVNFAIGRNAVQKEQRPTKLSGVGETISFAVRTWSRCARNPPDIRPGRGPLPIPRTDFRRRSHVRATNPV